MKIFLILLLLQTLTITTFAAQSLSTKVKSPYSSFRALGMGDAFTAVADDYSLIYYNPAGFAKKKHNEFQLSLLGAGVSNKTTTLVKDVDSASKTQGTDQEKAQAISDVLEQYYGKSLGGKVEALEIFWIRKNWGISLIPVDLTVDMTIDRQLGPAIDLNVTGDTILAYGYGTELNKFWSAGATLKYTHRVAVEQSVSALELATDSNVLSTKRFKEGQTVDLDLGFLWTPDWFNSAVVVEKKSARLEKKSIKRKIATAEKNTESEKAFKAKENEALSMPAKNVETEGASNPDANAATNSTVKESLPVADTKKADEAATAQSVPTQSVPPTPEAQAKTAEPLKEEIKKIEETSAEPKKEEVVAEEKKEVEGKKEKFPLTLGFVMHNVFGGSFIKAKNVNKDATETPSKMNRVIDVGSQYELAQFGDLVIRSMLDFKNLLHPNANTFNKVFHAGIEADYSPNGWFKTQLRGGINQMYYTAGATLLLGVVHIDFATYGEEVGTTSDKIENRVYAAKVGFNF